MNDDPTLLTAARRGDHTAWSELCRRHVPALTAYLGARVRRPELVDQFAGEAIHAAWRHLGELPEGGAFGPWFRKTGAGIAMKWAREHPDASIDEPFPAARLAPEQMPFAADLARLEQAIGTLPEAERMALELRWRGGLDDAALAGALRSTVEDALILLERAESTLSRVVEAA